MDSHGEPLARSALSLLALWLVIALSANAQQSPLRIAAAADLQPILPSVLEQFQQSTGIHADVTYQASAALATQILNGAPFDLFLSADLAYPKRLIDAGVADTAGVLNSTGFSDSSTPVTYARGTLVLWTRKDSQWPAPSLATLRDSRLRRLAIANPERAPYGKAAIAALTSLNLVTSLQQKLVTAENISQAAQFAETANADAGLISLTSAVTPHLASIGSYFVLPKDLYPPIEQGAVLITNSGQRRNAHKFLDFLLSAPIQQQLLKSGLTPVK